MSDGAACVCTPWQGLPWLRGGPPYSHTHPHTHTYTHNCSVTSPHPALPAPVSLRKHIGDFSPECTNSQLFPLQVVSFQRRGALRDNRGLRLCTILRQLRRPSYFFNGVPMESGPMVTPRASWPLASRLPVPVARPRHRRLPVCLAPLSDAAQAVSTVLN